MRRKQANSDDDDDENDDEMVAEEVDVDDDGDESELWRCGIMAKHYSFGFVYKIKSLIVEKRVGALISCVAELLLLPPVGSMLAAC